MLYGQVVTEEFTIDIESGSNSGSANLVCTGQLKHLHVDIPAISGVANATFTVENSGGKTLWTSAAKTANAAYNLDEDAEWVDQLLPLEGVVVKATLNANAGANASITCYARIFGFR